MEREEVDWYQLGVWVLVAGAGVLAALGLAPTVWERSRHLCAVEMGKLIAQRQILVQLDLTVVCPETGAAYKTSSKAGLFQIRCPNPLEHGLGLGARHGLVWQTNDLDPPTAYFAPPSTYRLVLCYVTLFFSSLFLVGTFALDGMDYMPRQGFGA